MQKEFSARLAWMTGIGIVVFLVVLGAGLWLLESSSVPLSERYPHARPENPLHETEFEAGLVKARVEGPAFARLHSYGWTDEKAGLAHIPIERAMELLLKQKGAKP